jgi:DNA polymerase-3 subunit gamma/tau
VLTVAFSTEADVVSFKQPQSPGESISEQLRRAIHQVLGVRVKFLARHEAAPAAPTPVPADDNPLPPAPEWNVIPIPSSVGTDAAAPEATKPSAEPAPAPEPEASAPATSTDGKARYGEAVVREILGASFIEEQSLAPTRAPLETAPFGEPEA